VPIQLTEIDADPEDLLTEISAGTLAEYRINGQPAATPLTTDSATGVTIAPGLTIDLLKAGEADVVVKKDINKLTGALSSLAAAYNNVMTEVDKHRGGNGGALAGQSIITGLTQSLRELFAYRDSGIVKNAASLGLTFSDKGVLSFNSTEFNEQALTDALEFIGDTDGSGLLGVAEEILDGFDDASTGLLPVASKSITDQIASTDKLITANQERIDLLQTRLANQMAAADALIGQMEQQLNYMNGLFDAMKTNAESF
jgi:flagellar capping protein FliD